MASRPHHSFYATARDTTLGAAAFALAAAFVAFIVIALVALVLRVTPSAFAAVLRSPTVTEALWLSLRTSAISAVIIALCGTPLAALLSLPFRGRALLETLITLPVVLPPVVGGLALLLAFGRAGLIGHELRLFGISLPFTTAAVVMAQIFVAAPLYVTVAKSAFARVDPKIIDAAATLRASRTYTFSRVIIPMVLPVLAGGLALAWARALGEFGATIMFAGNLPGVTQTMPIAVYVATQTDLQAAIAVAVVLMALSYAALLIVRHVGNSSDVTP
ncbi:MAG TPA: ABC transporter permease [Candidatus Eremiobacteraceae bacterium]|jgi:molybdate transport system permease protein|nr:ABC transporter permease [Candidatus Eremiobacteraceae bacterium]